MAIENTALAELWRDSTATPADRIKDLIPRMSVREKVAQLYGAWVGADATSGQVAPFQHSLSADATSYTGRAGRRIVEPGEVELWVGASSRDIRARLAARLTGPRREVGFDRRFQPEVSIIEG